MSRVHVHGKSAGSRCWRHTTAPSFASVDHFVFPSVEEGLVKHVEADAIEFEVFGACNVDAWKEGAHAGLLFFLFSLPIRQPRLPI